MHRPAGDRSLARYHASLRLLCSQVFALTECLLRVRASHQTRDNTSLRFPHWWPLFVATPAPPDLSANWINDWETAQCCLGARTEGKPPLWCTALEHQRVRRTVDDDLGCLVKIQTVG